MEGGGEGLYAMRDVEKDEIVAFYNGVGSQGGSAVDVSVNFPFRCDCHTNLGRRKTGKLLRTKYL